MNIFEENKKKYEIKSKGQMAIMGLAILFTGGIMFTIGLPLSFIVIGIPFVIIGIILMFAGGLMVIMAPFWNPNRKVKSFKEMWQEGKERDKRMFAKAKQLIRK